MPGFFAGLYKLLIDMVTEPKSITFCSAWTSSHEVDLVYHLLKKIEKKIPDFFERLEKALSDDALSTELEKHGIQFPETADKIFQPKGFVESLNAEQAMAFLVILSS